MLSLPATWRYNPPLPNAISTDTFLNPVDVGGPPGNSTFKMLPTGNSSGTTNCLFLTGVDVITTTFPPLSFSIYFQRHLHYYPYLSCSGMYANEVSQPTLRHPNPLRSANQLVMDSNPERDCHPSSSPQRCSLFRSAELGTKQRKVPCQWSGPPPTSPLLASSWIATHTWTRPRRLRQATVVMYVLPLMVPSSNSSKSC